MAKLDNSILESSDKDFHSSKDSNKGSETEPTNISEVTEKSGQVSQFSLFFKVNHSPIFRTPHPK